jgi:hypothetical protein
MRLLILLIFLYCPLLSALEVHFEGRSSEDIHLQVKKGTFSFLVSLEFDSKEALMVESLVDPDGREYIKSNIGSPSEYRVPAPVYSSFRSLLRMTYVSKNMASIFVSNSDSEISVRDGTWTLKIAKQKSKEGGSRVFINLKELKEDSLKKASLDLTVNYDLDNSSIDKTVFLNAIKELKSFYSQYGINLNIKPNQWIDPFLHEKDLELKLPMLQRGQRRNLQMYIFKRNSSIKKDFQGVAGCLPAVIIKKIREHCGLIVAYENQEHIDFKKMIKVMAHEIAHYLGLFHLADQFYPFGVLQDPIEDTFNAIDRQNVMHKTSDYFGQMDFTRGQIKTMLKNPILYLK